MSVTTEKPASATAIRPFRADVSEEAVVDLRRRLAATRWPDPETVPDQSQGAQLSRLQGLVRYWGTDYDWRRAEATLNAFLARYRDGTAAAQDTEPQAVASVS